MRALDFGAMMSVAYPMSREDRRGSCEIPGDQRTGHSNFPRALIAATGGCADRGAAPFLVERLEPQRGQCPLSNGRRGRTEGIDKVRNLKLKWAFGFDGDVTSFAPPTVIDGQVFVGGAGGVIHALRAETGLPAMDVPGQRARAFGSSWWRPRAPNTPC